MQQGQLLTIVDTKIPREHGMVETTVKIHVQHILRKLGVSSRVHAAVIASPDQSLPRT